MKRIRVVFEADVIENCGYPMCRNGMLPGTMIELTKDKFKEGDRVRIVVEKYQPREKESEGDENERPNQSTKT